MDWLGGPASDPDAFLDVFTLPRSRTPIRRCPPLWLHGGAWVAGKRRIASYLKVLAGRGYALVGVNYSLAPDKTYPIPLRQANACLSRSECRNACTSTPQDSSSPAIQLGELTATVSIPAYAKQVGIQPSVDRPQLRQFSCRPKRESDKCQRLHSFALCALAIDGSLIIIPCWVKSR